MGPQTQRQPSMKNHLPYPILINTIQHLMRLHIRITEHLLRHCRRIGICDLNIVRGKVKFVKARQTDGLVTVVRLFGRWQWTCKTDSPGEKPVPFGFHLGRKKCLCQTENSGARRGFSSQNCTIFVTPKIEISVTVRKRESCLHFTYYNTYWVYVLINMWKWKSENCDILKITHCRKYGMCFEYLTDFNI